MSDINTYADQTAIDALTPITGDLVLRESDNNVLLWNGSAWKSFAPDASYTNEFSLSFDGANDYATSNFTPATSSGATISFWINMPSLSINSAPYNSGTGTSAATGSLSLIFHKTLGYYIQVGNGTDSSLHHSSNGFGSGATASNSSSLGYITDSLWHHVAVTIDGTSIKLYVDGGDASITASRTSNTQGTPYLTATSSIAYTGGVGSVTKIGQGHTTYYPQIAACKMDEIAYFETALSGSEVSSVYNGGTPADLFSLSPAVWWRMGENDSAADGAASSTITDQGSAGQDLSTQNSPTFSASFPS